MLEWCFHQLLRMLLELLRILVLLAVSMRVLMVLQLRVRFVLGLAVPLVRLAVVVALFLWLLLLV